MERVREVIVVPVRPDSFHRLIEGEHRWYPIRVGDRPAAQARYMAVYFPAPISAITHLADIKSIELWKGPFRFAQDHGKRVINIDGKPSRIEPVPSGPRVKSIQSVRYTTIEELRRAKTLDDLW